MTTVDEHDDNRLLGLLSKLGIVPLVTLHSLDEAVPIAKALDAGGIPVMEVTFRSPYALDGMRLIHHQVPDVTLIAGTVHSVEQAAASIAAGCAGLVTPGFDDDIVEWSARHNVPLLPGTAVPSDIERAYDRGMRCVKFFPAEIYGGVKALMALSGPFGDMQFLPTGGISFSNLADYLRLPNVLAVGGSFPVPPTAQRERNWGQIVDACHKARALARSIRPAKEGVQYLETTVLER